MKLLRIVITSCCVSICSLALAIDKVTLVPVTASGWGPTKSDAVKAALGEAVAQVTGRAIDAANEVQTSSTETYQDDKESFSLTTEMSQRISDRYRGIVDSYEVARLVEDKGGWEATVVARVARMVSSKSKRKPLAIVPFTYGRETFSVLGSAVDPAEASRLLTQSVVDKVTSSRRFMVVDREFLEAAHQEASLAADNPMLPLAKILELASTAAAEYMIVGQLETLSVTSRSRELQGFDRPFVTRQATASITFRVIDVASKQVKYAGTDAFVFGNDEIPATAKSIALVAKVLEIAAERLSETMLDAIYPILVAGVSGDRLTLNQGGDLVKQGSVYDIYRYGEKIYDPYSRESLGREEIPVGTVAVSEVRSKMSVAMVQSTIEDLEAGFAPKKYVLRLKTRGKSAQQKNKSANFEKSKIRLRSKKEATDTDW